MAVRSDYIKKIIDSKKTLEKEYENVIKESMRNIIGENAKDGLRRLLKESEEDTDDEDSFTEEDVIDDTASTDKDKEDDNDDTDTETEVEDETDTDDSTDVEDETDDDIIDNDGDYNWDDSDDEENTGNDDLWNDLEYCKSADGEYDCRGMDNENLIKVLKAMGPEDGIRVISNGDGTATVEVDGDKIDGEQEFVIDLDDDMDDVDESCGLKCNESNLGYTTKYQRKTAMTTPSNHEPSNPKTTYSMDGGVPTGIERPYGGNVSNMHPYDVNEECDCDDDIDFEIETEDEDPVNEVMSSSENNPVVRGTGMTHANTNLKGKKFRSSSEGGVRVKGTGYNSYSGEETNESLKRRLNRLCEENRQMKSLIPKFQDKLNECIVINASMGYIVRLLNENSTTNEEKKSISQRFTKVNSIEEGKKLYEAISEELHRVNRRNDMKDVINSQLAEGKQQKQNLVETTMYKSEKVNEALDFMKRLNKVK